MARYRDSRTGKFVSAKTWKRSKAQGGGRYKKESEKKKRKEREITPPPPPPSKSMWRVTVSASYYHRAPGRNKKKSRQSISSSYMVRSWYRTEREAKAAVEELTQTAIDGRLEVLENNSRAWWKGGEDTVNTEVTRVAYDQRLLDVIEEKDENIS